MLLLLVAVYMLLKYIYVCRLGWTAASQTRFTYIQFDLYLASLYQKNYFFKLSYLIKMLPDYRKILIPQGALAAQKENDEVDYAVELANARKFQANFTQTLVASSARCFEQVDIFKILLNA